MTKSEEWDSKSIIAALHRRGMTLTRLAELNNVAPGGFRTIWVRPNSRNEKIIADYLNVPVEVLFRDRYPKRTTSILSPKYLANPSDRKLARNVA